MSVKKFRWTRKRYRKADSLARFMTRHLYDLPEQPRILRRYFELWDLHPQREDPLLTPVCYRYDRDDIPF